MTFSKEFDAFDRRLKDMETQRDLCFRNGTILDTKFENNRWYVKMADDVTVASDGTGSLTTQGQPNDGSAPDQSPNLQTDWLPWQSSSNDAISWVVPPRVGQRVTLHAPYGRQDMGHIVPYHTGPTNPLPSGNPDEVRLQIKPHDQQPTTNNPKPPDGSAPNSTLDIIQNKDGHTTQVSSTNPDGSSQGPYTKTSASNTVKSVETQKVTQNTEQTKIKEAAQDTISRGTGTSDPEQVDAGDGGGAGNLPHELNRQLQGLRAEVTQHTHHLAALHDQMSSIIDLAIPKVPMLAQLLPFLNHQPQGLMLAANNVLGQLEAYVASSLQQTVAKLTSSFMGNAMSLVSGTVSGNIAQNIAQIGGLASASDAAFSSTSLLQAAQTAYSAIQAPVNSGSNTNATADITPLITALQPIQAAFVGTGVATDVSGIVTQITALNPVTAATYPNLAPLMTQLAAIYTANAGPGNITATINPSLTQATALTADPTNINMAALTPVLAILGSGFTGATALPQVQNLLGQVSGTAGSASGLFAGLSGLLGSQENLISGMTKSYRLGGY